MKKEGDVSYISRNSLLYKSKVEYADFCINHVEGCAHGCRFPCYAFMMAKRFGKVKNYQEWCKPKIVKNALKLLDKEIPRYKKQIKFVHLCFMTDPFMYRYPEVKELTLKIIEKLNLNGIKCTVLTKGILPRELTNNKKYSKKNEYGITLISLDNNFKKKYEPNSAPYNWRIKALKILHDAGLKTWVSMEPYPTLNLVKQNLWEILNEISFVDNIIFGKLNYNTRSSDWKNNQKNKLFYEIQARIIKKFCKEKGIKYHIKHGTQEKYNHKTSKIFKRRETPLVNFQIQKEREELLITS